MLLIGYFSGDLDCKKRLERYLMQRTTEHLDILRLFQIHRSVVYLHLDILSFLQECSCAGEEVSIESD